MPTHVMAVPVLDRGGAADRMRNHLRRRAITRLGLIEGDLYMLPFWRVSGQGPEGETTFHILAAETGDPRLTRTNLLPADLKPFDEGTLPAATRVVPHTLDDSQVRQRAAELGWRAGELEQLIHYPFWMMRIEDSARIEGGWIDGIEGKVIHHTLRVPPPVPSLKRCAVLLAVPAAAMAVATLLSGDRRPVLPVLIAAAAWFVLDRMMKSDARKERQG